MRILSVRPSVYLSVKRVDCDKTEEWLVGGDPFYLKCWVNWPPLERKGRFFKSLFAPSASAVTSSEKVQLTLIGSPLRAFQ